MNREQRQNKELTEKYPFLLPFYTIKRWFALLSSKKRKTIKKELEYKKGFTDEKLRQTDAFLKELGINS